MRERKDCEQLLTDAFGGDVGQQRGMVADGLLRVRLHGKTRLGRDAHSAQKSQGVLCQDTGRRLADDAVAQVRNASGGVDERPTGDGPVCVGQQDGDGVHGEVAHAQVVVDVALQDGDVDAPLGGAGRNVGDAVDAAFRVEGNGGPAHLSGNPLRQRLGVVGHGKVDVMRGPA